MRLLLQDQRVMVNEPDKDGSTPLWWAAYRGHHDAVKLWIASGREMNLGKPGDVDKTDAIGAAKQAKKTEVATLLERFKSDPTKTRSELRKELGMNGQYYCYLLLLLLLLLLFPFILFQISPPLI